MSRESGSERSQRTVAELLAQYGANSEEAPPRRRRRRADEPTDTSPQTIIDRVVSDSGNMLPIRDERPAEETTVDGPPVRAQSPMPSAPPVPQKPVTQQQPLPRPPQGPPPGQQPSGQLPAPMRPPTPNRPTPGRTPPPRIESSRTNLSRSDLGPRPAPQQQQQPTGYYRPPGQAVDAIGDTTQHPPIPPAPQQPQLAARLSGAPPEPATEQMPKITDAPVAENTQAHPGPLVDDDGYEELQSTQGHPGPYVDDDEYADEDYEYTEDEAFAGYSVEPGAAPAGVDTDLDEESDEDAGERSPTREWLMMAAQLGVGLIGGAALWLGFQWLWDALPAAALAAAIAVIVGLVVVVRKIRKADDLQTMVLAVLVGLIVTVSPAALRLVGH